VSSKGWWAGESDSFGVWRKWCCGQSVVGPVFLVFFAVQFCELWGKRKKIGWLTIFLGGAKKKKNRGGGNLPTGPPSLVLFASRTDEDVNRVSPKMKSAVCLSAHLSIFLVF
jgi:hypothetical protein